MQHRLSKKSLRKQCLDRRQLLSDDQWEQKSLEICRHVHEYAVSQSVSWLGCYAAYRHEPDLSSLLGPPLSFTLGQKAYGTALPKIIGNGSMAFYSYEQGDPHEKNAYGILEPQINSSKLVDPVKDVGMLILVPALAVDEMGYRLGYGGGYYDRYLEKFSALRTIAVVFSEFIMKSLPVESHDQRMSGYVTEAGLKLFQ